MFSENQSLLSRLIQNLLLIIYSIFALFPLFWMALITFKSDLQMFNTTFFFTPTLENYKAVLIGTITSRPLSTT
jgi:multiple sugar transport system permease protein